MARSHPFSINQTALRYAWAVRGTLFLTQTMSWSGETQP
jgi:hypothetical protein